MLLSTTNVELDAVILEKLQTIAEAGHRSPDSVIREAIDEYLTRVESRDRLNRDAIEALEHYQATGLHLTQDEVERWMDELDLRSDAQLPQCHT